jgi:hypothetical protein
MPSFNGRRPDSMMLKQDGHFSASNQSDLGRSA